MSTAKQNYDIHDKKLLIIISALQKWKIYAENCSELTIFTDHNFFFDIHNNQKIQQKINSMVKIVGTI